MADPHDGRIPTGRFGRIGRIAGMATRVGAGLAKDRVKRLLGRSESSAAMEAAARHVLETLGTLKGAALKAGQTLSLFANTLPPEVRLVLGKLYSQAPTLPFAEIAKVIEAELGASPDALFAEISREPLAAASLGQVHAARLHGGERVAVKVQYPGVGAALEDDLRNLGTVMKAVGVVIDSAAYLEEIRREVTLELDYTKERERLEAFRGYLARWPDLVVPRAWPELSAKRVLTLELLEGPTLNQAAETIDAMPEAERWHRADQLVRAGWGPLLYDRVVHADAHPGNYVLMTDGRLGVLDFGNVKYLSEPFWRAVRSALKVLVEDRHEVDWIALHRAGGFEIRNPNARTLELFETIRTIARRPVEGVHDFGTDTTLVDLAGLKMKYPFELLSIQPPAEALFVARGLAGVLQNLTTLKAKGDLRPFFRTALAETRA
ncbi:MAG: AarF/ABC1/UbiB kinase family protein [Myxococcaceae bacterium]|nr:AarF/ABC1/UbiB kinase family protein [Myxococcaceae bacterium]